MIDLVALAQINLNLLLSLKALLDECNVSKAAERLNLTQSTMSRNLTQLRDYFQDPLLVRSGKHNILSAKAHELLPKLDEFLAAIQCMLDSNFVPSRQPKEFIIAAPDYVSLHILNDSLMFINTQFSKINFTIVNWDRFAKKMLIAGEIHLAISIDDTFPSNMFRRVVDEDYLVCVAGPKHPRYGQDALRLEDFVAHPHVSVVTGGGWEKVVDRPLHGLGLRRNVKLRVPSYRLAFSVVESTDFLAVVPMHVARNSADARNLKSFPLPFAAQTVKMSLWWHESHHNDGAHKWLREVLFPKLLSHPHHHGLSAERHLATPPPAAPAPEQRFQPEPDGPCHGTWLAEVAAEGPVP
ncbi:MAG: LysR family transcriptional regulator [Solidesulfovibrio sp. DCME]|uniref:LysR family transcriptional regulator n=1 Tax=Solidesulfovibrio sp. DCME TaxID=3447380 RepID=UPI003D0C3DB1